MSLLTALIAKSSHIWAGIYFIFLENVLHQASKSFNTKLLPKWKSWKSSYQVRKILVVFCKLFPVNLKLSKSFYSHKNCPTNEIWRGVEQGRSKKLFPEKIIQKTFETNSNFFVKYPTTGKFQFLFCRENLLALTKFSLREVN